MSSGPAGPSGADAGLDASVADASDTPGPPSPATLLDPPLAAAFLDRAPLAAFLDSAPLAQGDLVALVGPSSPSSPDSVERAVGYLEGWGLRVRVGEHILARDPRADFLAGTDAQRLADLEAAWADPQVDAIICVRGGDGAMRLVDDVDWAGVAPSALRGDGRPKLFTGSSDATALHEAVRLHLGLPTLFCPMVGNDVFAESATIRDDVHRWLFEPWAGREIVGPAAEVLVPGRAEGVFRGGNLSRVVGAIGAPEAAPLPVGHHEILFLEDVGENVSRLDGMVTQLLRSDRPASVAGIVLGSWTDCGDLGPIRDLMADRLSGLGVPVMWQQGFGHDPDALSVPLGVRGVLDLSGAPSLRVTGGSGTGAGTGPEEGLSP